MIRFLYSCNTCKREGKEFLVPADEIGQELMTAHLEEHGFFPRRYVRDIMDNVTAEESDG